MTEPPTNGYLVDTVPADAAASIPSARSLGTAAGQAADGNLLKPLFDHYVDGGNTTTSETDLFSDTLVASQLANNGEKLEARYAGTFVAHATATRQVKLYFGGTAIFDSGALATTAAEKWMLDAWFVRTAATSIRYAIQFFAATTAGANPFTDIAVGTLGGLTLSNTNVLKITGTAAAAGAATNDIVATIGTVLWRPAA